MKASSPVREKTQPLPLVYSCSGCSSVAQMANHVALQLDRRVMTEIATGLRPLSA